MHSLRRWAHQCPVQPMSPMLRERQLERLLSPVIEARGRSSAIRRSIRAVVVDDNPSVRTLLCMILEQDPDMTVVGAAADGGQGLALVKRLRPDVVTMDLTMPGCSGLEATAAIMREAPTRVIVISSLTGPSNAAQSLEAVRAGALAVLHGPPSLRSDEFASHARTIRDVVRSSASVRLAIPSLVRPAAVDTQLDAVLLGWAPARTAPLQRILALLPLHPSVPIALICGADDDPRVVAASLLPSSSLPVRAVVAAQPLLPGSVYVLGAHATVAMRHGVPIAVPSQGTPGEARQGAPAFAAFAEAFSGRVLAVLPAVWDGAQAQVAQELLLSGCRVIAALADAFGGQRPASHGATVASLADLTLPAQMLGPYVRKQLALPMQRAA